MPYTLAKWALWLIAAAVIGLAVGWLLRGLRRPAAPAAGAEELAELDRLRACEQELEQVQRDRARLRIELDDCRETATAARAAAVAAVGTELEVAPSAVAGGATPDVRAERDHLAALVSGHEVTIGELRARLWNQDAKISELQGLVSASTAATAPPEPDLVAGAAVLGEKVRHNDLTVVEGIGPKIADLLHTKGNITTWWELHLADVTTLRSLLASAGPRFQVHDPASWPEQAGLLARGEWQLFKSLTDRLRGGKLGE